MIVASSCTNVEVCSFICFTAQQIEYVWIKSCWSGLKSSLNMSLQDLDGQFKSHTDGVTLTAIKASLVSAFHPVAIISVPEVQAKDGLLFAITSHTWAQTSQHMQVAPQHSSGSSLCLSVSLLSRPSNKCEMSGD